MSDIAAWLWLDADRVVAEGLADARAGKMISVPCRRYRLIVRLVSCCPRAVVARAMARRWPARQPAR